MTHRISPAFAPLPWMEQAECATGYDPDLWFPGDGFDGQQRAATAVAVCTDCRVAAECLDYALQDTHLEGIWGGLTHKQRNHLNRKRNCA